MHVLKRLFGFLTPYGKTLILSAVLLLGRAGLELVPPLFQRSIVDEVIGARQLGRLGLYIGLLVGAYALQQAVNSADLYIRHALGEQFIFDLRVRLYAYLQRLSLSFFERTSTGVLTPLTLVSMRNLMPAALRRFKHFLSWPLVGM